MERRGKHILQITAIGLPALLLSGCGGTDWEEVAGEACQASFTEAQCTCMVEGLTEQFDGDEESRMLAAFVASIKAAKWVLHYRTFLEQPALMEDLLADFREEIEAMAGQEDDTLQSAILLWRIIHQQISEWQTAHPDWIFLRHEDLSRDPEAEFRALYDRLGLEFTEKVRRDMQQYTGQQRSKGPQLYNRARIIRDSRSNILRWKERLSPEEIATIRQAVEPISSRFYTDADW